MGLGVAGRGVVGFGVAGRGRVWCGGAWCGGVECGGAGRDGAERTMWYLKQLKLFLCPSDHLVDCFVVRKFVFVLSIVTTKKSEPSSKKQIKQVCLVVAIRDANKQ